MMWALLTCCAFGAALGLGLGQVVPLLLPAPAPAGPQVPRRQDRLTGAFLAASVPVMAHGAGIDSFAILGLSCLLGWALVALALIDLRTWFLPDMVTIPLIAAGMLASIAGLTGPLFDHAVGACLGYALIWGLASAYKMLRGQDGMGLGDAKLLAAGGAWCGWTALPGILLIGCFATIAAICLSRAKGNADPTAPVPLNAIPFGPGLALGIWLTWLLGPLVWAWGQW